MRRRCIRIPRQVLAHTRKFSTRDSNSPIISIRDGTFYRAHPAAAKVEGTVNPSLFPELQFVFPSATTSDENWAIIGASNAGKSTLLEIFQGKHVCLPPSARSYPYLSSKDVSPGHRVPSRAIQYVGFDGDRGAAGKSGARGAYMSARYESRREAEDFSVLDYLLGNTDLNAGEEVRRTQNDESTLKRITSDLCLQDLINMPMGNLSNGQIRRARIAKAVLQKPLVLLLDEPFMGLDPPTTASLSPLLKGLAEKSDPRLILALRPQDPIPNWITHLLYLNSDSRVAALGEKVDVQNSFGKEFAISANDKHSRRNSVIHRGLPEVMGPQGQKGGLTIQSRLSREGLLVNHAEKTNADAPSVVEMHDVHIKYGQREILGDWKVQDPETASIRQGFWWNVRRGDRWGVFGPNGSGKTTLISLICSDHPLSYSLPIKIFGRGRLPEPGKPGISVFDIQARIGQSSPEVHAFFPKDLSIRQVIENAWADTFLGTPKLVYENDVAVDACLRWFEAELNPQFDPSTTLTKKSKGSQVALLRETDWADHIRFGESPFSAQRVALFLRAIVKKPELVVLDEAFSGMDEYVRDKCMLFLTWGETRTLAVREGDPARKRFVKATRTDFYEEPMFEGLSADQALICVSHVKEEVPGIVRDWLCLPEAGSGSPARFGKFQTRLDTDESQWNQIWDM